MVYLQYSDAMLKLKVQLKKKKKSLFLLLGFRFSRYLWIMHCPLKSVDDLIAYYQMAVSAVAPLVCFQVRRLSETLPTK